LEMATFNNPTEKKKRGGDRDLFGKVVGGWILWESSGISDIRMSFVRMRIYKIKYNHGPWGINPEE